MQRAHKRIRWRCYCTTRHYSSTCRTRICCRRCASPGLNPQRPLFLCPRLREITTHMRSIRCPHWRRRLRCRGRCWCTLCPSGATWNSSSSTTTPTRPSRTLCHSRSPIWPPQPPTTRRTSQLNHWRSVC